MTHADCIGRHHIPGDAWPAGFCLACKSTRRQWVEGRGWVGPPCTVCGGTGRIDPADFREAATRSHGWAAWETRIVVEADSPMAAIKALARVGGNRKKASVRRKWYREHG